MADQQDTSLRVQDLTFAYWREPVLRGVSFELQKSAIGLLGPNGSGKTTLLRALLGQLKLAPGHVHVLGRDMAVDARHARAALGWMPERGGIIPGTSGVALVAYMGELARMPRRDAMQRAHEVLHFVGLGDERYRRCDTYSQGMRQRLKLATALVHDPQWLLLDEPTSGLDPGGRSDILALVADLARNKGLGVILSTHLLADVQSVCQEILVLREGELLARKPVDAHGAQGRQVFEVEGFGGEDALRTGLARLGAEVETSGRTLLVTLDVDRFPVESAADGDRVALAVRAILGEAAAAGFATRRLRVRPVTLADQFHAMVRKD